MSRPLCQSLRAWLKANLGPRCLAALTSTDAVALDAAMQVAALWAHEGHPEVLAEAFARVVLYMQPTTLHLAFHAVAHFANWEDREELWIQAELPWPDHLTLCAHEPGGRARS